MTSHGCVLTAGLGLFFWAWFAVQEQIPVAEWTSQHLMWCLTELSLNHNMAEVIHCTGLSLDCPFSSVLPSEFRDSGNTNSHLNYLRNSTSVSRKSLSLNYLCVLSCHSTPTLISIPPFSFHWMGLSLHLFSSSLSLFLPIQNIFPCLQNWTPPHYSSVPLSVSSLLHCFFISSYTSQFAVFLRCFVVLLLFVAELYNSTKVLLSFWYLVFHFFYFQS